MKVQNEMSTRISVDTVEAIGSMKAFREAVSAASSSWKAQEAQLKGSGQYYEALKSRISGLSNVIDIQKSKISELKQRQEGLDQTNAKQGEQWLKLESQIAQANRQLAGYESQLSKAQSQTSYYSSGLSDLQHSYRMNLDVANSYVRSLRAQGEHAKADQEELKSLRKQLSNLTEQQSKQKTMLSELEKTSGKASDAYKRQQIQLNKTSETIAKTSSQAKKLQESLEPKQTTWLERLRKRFLRAGDSAESARRRALDFGTAIKANVVGAGLNNAFGSLIGGLKGVVTNGTAAAQAGAAFEARWKNIGVDSKGINQLSAQLKEVKANSNLSADAVNSLQTKFYGMTHSVKQTKTLTQGVASLSDQLKLSQDKADAFAGGLSRIESSGKVTSSSLGRLERQAPGLSTALQKASGMSQKSFQALVSSGKMTSSQFNDILSKASKDYKKNSDAFGKTSGGAMHKLQQDWLSTQAQLAKPLLKVSSTGLNELNKALRNKDTQNGLELLAKAMAKVAVWSAKFIGFLSKHQKIVWVFGGAILSLYSGFKLMQGALVTVEVVQKFVNLMKSAKMVAAFAGAIRGIKTALSVATMGFNPWVIGIEAVVAGFTLLYTHSKKFRKFVNGIASAAKKGMANVGKWFSKGWSNIKKNTSNTWNKLSKAHQKFHEQGIKLAKKNNELMAKSWQSLNRNVAKWSKSMWNNASRDARNGWNYVVRWGSSASKNVIKGWNKLSRDTNKLSQTMFKGHEKTFKAGYKVLQDRTKTWRDFTHGHWDKLGDDTKRTAEDMFKFQKRLWKDSYDKLNDLTGGRLGDMVKAWQDKMKAIANVVSDAKEAVRERMIDLVRGALKPINSLLNGIKSGINWVLDKIGANKITANWSIPLPSYATGTRDTHPGGLAVVNDAKSGHYREMYKLPTGEVGMFPAKRNMIVPLPKGTSVLDGERSYSLMQSLGHIPHYANGTLSAVSDFIGNIKDSVDGFVENVDKFIAHPVEFMESVFKRFIHINTPIQFATDMIEHLPIYIADQAKNWVKEQLGTLSNPSGSGVERWRPYIIRAFKQLGYDAEGWKITKLLKQIQTESNGNPTVTQKVWDVNMASGNPAQGLLQFISSTFARWAVAGHKNIKNGYDSILAAINALQHGGEGGWSNVGMGHGWAYGGLVSRHGVYEVAENNLPEYIIPTDVNKRSRAYQLLGELVTKFHNDDPMKVPTTGNNNSLDELNQKFDKLLSMFGTLLNLNEEQIQSIQNQGSLDMKKLYRKQAMDASMRAYS